VQTKKLDKELLEKSIMDFRHSIVAELANPYLEHGECIRLIREKSLRHWDIPYSSKNSISQATIKQWLKLYRQYGKEGLRPKRRTDSGNSRAISAMETQALSDLLASQPELTATGAWRKLLQEGKVKTNISSSSLSRLVSAQGLRRNERLKEKSLEQNLKFEFFYPLECVQADCLHGPLIPRPNGKACKAILLAFIDDATRRIVYAEFSASEHSLAFEKGIRHILLAHGRIGRLYVDNGSTFVSLQTERILNTLQIHLVHSKPYKPQGRGKIERFFRTVRDCFLRPLDTKTVKSFDELNLLFRTWLESEYHRNPHNGLGKKTPLEAWVEKAQYIKRFDPFIDIENVFLHECHRRVAKDQTVTVNGQLYEAPCVLTGKKVKLRYDPQRLGLQVEAWFEGKNYGYCRKLRLYENTRVKRSMSKKGAFVEQTKDPVPSVHAGLTAAGLKRNDL